MKADNQNKVIELLTQDGWQPAGTTLPSFPSINPKPRFTKNGWTACVGLVTTTFYKKPQVIERYPGWRGMINYNNWQTDSIPTKEIERIQAKLKECV
jgi:hypothetical protein